MVMYCCNRNLALAVVPSACAQANPQDADNFPFMLLGNKIDVDGGNARVVGVPLEPVITGQNQP